MEQKGEKKPVYHFVASVNGAVYKAVNTNDSSHY